MNVRTALLLLLAAVCGRRVAYVEPRTTMRFVRVEPGSFQTGSHHVTLTRPFLISAAEETQRQWARSCYR